MLELVERSRAWRAGGQAPGELRSWLRWGDREVVDLRKRDLGWKVDEGEETEDANQVDADVRDDGQKGKSMRTKPTSPRGTPNQESR